jgi:hypothetical protein
MEGVVDAISQSQSEAIGLLKQNVTTLNAKDRTFAQSLVDQFQKKQSLSDKQMFWVEKLASRAMGIPDFTMASVDVGGFSGVIELFNKAAANLKYPAIAMSLPGGQGVKLKLLGTSSKHHGSVSVCDFGAFGANKYYGRVSKDGQWFPASDAALIKDELTAMLTKLAKCPARVAAEYGKMSGHCCFCMSPLTDKKSTEVGYGPVCAKQWGLPWGAQEKKSA